MSCDLAVFVLDRSGKALMPCSEKRARLLLDPGSKATGLALVRDTGHLDIATGEIQRGGVVLNLFELVHRGRQIREALTARRAMRRRRRGTDRQPKKAMITTRKQHGTAKPHLRRAFTQHRDTRMSHTVSLNNYFTRIGYTGPREATLEVLQQLHALHPKSIPFENLNPLTRRAVKLDLESIEEKLVIQHRGGYCFEQNALFASVLKQLGFKVTPLLARVLWGREPDAIPPRTHMVLRIDIGNAKDNKAWIADVGFGSVTLTAPLHLTAGIAQPTQLGTFRLADASHNALHLEVQGRDNTWSRVYRFDLQPVEWIDYETSNWYTSTSPDSIFASNLIVTRVLAQSRLTLLNDQLNEHAAHGQIVSERQLRSANELASCLRDQFGLNTGDIDIADVFSRVRASAAHIA